MEFSYFEELSLCISMCMYESGSHWTNFRFNNFLSNYWTSAGMLSSWNILTLLRVYMCFVCLSVCMLYTQGNYPRPAFVIGAQPSNLCEADDIENASELDGNIVLVERG